MKRHTQSTKLPSFRPNLEKRHSNNQQLLALTKPEFGQEITNEELPLSATQNEITKKIQSKLRLRKAIVSQKRESREEERTATVDRVSVQNNDLEDFQGKMEEIWENSPDISEVLEEFASSVVPSKLKERLLKEAGKLRCQSLTNNLEELMVLRVKKLCLLMTSERRCGEHETLVTRLLDQRMSKLNSVLKTR